MMAPTDERGNSRLVPLGYRLDTAVSPIGYPSSETQYTRCRNR